MTVSRRWALALSVAVLMIVSSVGFPMANVGAGSADTGIEPLSPTPPPMVNDGNSIYHTYDELTTELQGIDLFYGSIAKLISIGQTWEGREIWAMKISDNVDIDEDEPEVFINGCHHAREWMTVEVTLYFINWLVGNYSTNTTAQYLVNNREIWVIPMVNPDGRVYDGAGPGDDPNTNMMWRKNRRDNGDGTWGVDLNRNYGFMWGGAGAAGDTGSEIYAGPGPFSEPESQATRDFVRNHSFVTSISYHSYSQLILWPWGIFSEPAPDDVLMRALGYAMRDNITNTVGSNSQPYVAEQAFLIYGQPISGGDIDWLYGEQGIFAYVIELYPAASDPIGDKFHPPASTVIPVCVDNLPGMICLSMAAGNPYQVMDHITLTPDPESQLINQDTTGYFTINALNDGLRDDVFDISSNGPPGWTINHPASISLLRNEDQNFTLDVTVPAFSLGGDYTIWVNATSQTNTTCEYGTSVIVTVPFMNDTAIISHSPFVENGQYPQGNINMRAVVMNYGQLPLDPFDLNCTISQLGGPITSTIFWENFESGLGDWTVIDHDGSHSPSYWHIVSTTSHSPTSSVWCGSGGGYQATTMQSLETAVPISLRGASGANLTFWHRYRTEFEWDFGTLEVSGDGGATWTHYGRYHGIDDTWHQETIDIGALAGSQDVVIRYFFSSDGNTQDTGWYIDDVSVNADYRSETIIWGPTPEPTPGILYQNDTLECSWQYTFVPGQYKATYETTLATDERPDNDMMDVVFEITPATLPGVVVIQPNSGEVWLAGSSEEVTWNAFAGSYPFAANPISIYYSVNGSGGPYSLIADNEPNDGTYTWNPIPNTQSNDCWVLIEAEDNQGFVGSDISDMAFGIQVDPPEVWVSSPNGGETLMGGGSWAITWTATGNLKANPITISYSISGPGGPWNPLASSEANDGTYTWNPVPLLDENNCYILIIAEDMLGFFGQDISNSSFAIDSTAPLPASNPYAELTGSNDVTIYWTASPSPDVDHYEIWFRTNGWDPAGDTLYSWLDSAVIPAGTTDYVHVGRGVNNSGSYSYQVRTYDVAGHETKTTTQAAKFSRTLGYAANPSHWWLVGSALVQSSTSIDHVIQGLGLPGDYVMAWDAVNQEWISDMPGRPDTLNDLTDITNEMGFWLRIVANSRFCTAGYIEDMNVNCYAGWNLLPYPYAERSKNTNDIEADLIANCPNYVPGSLTIFDYDEQYGIRAPAGDTISNNEEGFWIQVTSDTVWMVINY